MEYIVTLQWGQGPFGARLRVAKKCGEIAANYALFSRERDGRAGVLARIGLADGRDGDSQRERGEIGSFIKSAGADRSQGGIAALKVVYIPRDGGVGGVGHG